MAPDVDLPRAPFWPNDWIRDDPVLLDELAGAYQPRGDDEHLDAARFLYGELPLIAFDRLFDESAEPIPTASLLWLFYLSGYWGGVWLRGELERAGQTERLTGVSIPPSQQAFELLLARVRVGVEAAKGNDADVLAHNRARLLPAGDALALVDGLIENFGYNQGYLLEILESPPDGLSTPPDFGVTATGPLACRYETPRLKVLARLQRVADALASGSTPAYAQLAKQIVPLQQAAEQKGRAVWSGGLSVQGFRPAEYELLLAVSSSFLEDVQATALATVQAVAENDAAIGRRAAVAEAVVGLWLASYGTGLMEDRRDGAAPRFEAP